MTGFWIFMLVMNMLIPFTMMGLGWRFMKKPPEKINKLYGYRTSMSMKNRETWAFAHEHCGRLWLVMGIVLLPVSLLPLVLGFGLPVDRVGLIGLAVCCVQLVFLIMPVVFTEIALKKTFDKNGNRK